MTAGSTYSNYSTSRTFPYGRYKGGMIRDIPTDYLEYVLRDHTPRHWLEEAIREELRSREVASNSKPAVPSLVDPEWAFEVVDAGKRALSLRYHPDLANGDLYAMQSVNIAADWLRDHLSAVFETAEGRR